MKKIFTLTLLCFSAMTLLAQSSKQVQWTFSTKKIADKTYEIHLVATIGGNYHMYSQNAGVEGPVPTSIKLTANPLVQVDGKAKEQGKMIKKYESSWPGTVNYYEKTVEFVQVVKLRGNIKTNLGGSVEFMVCNDSQCLPPATVDFKVNIGG